MDEKLWKKRNVKRIGIMACLLVLLMCNVVGENRRNLTLKMQERQGPVVANGNEERKPGMLLIEDQNGIWAGQTSVDIFAQTYKGSMEAGLEDQFTVENDGTDRRKLIAPGTGKSYQFQITNCGETDMNYTVSFREENTCGNPPLQVRMKCGDNYFVGGETEWESIEVINEAVHEGVLMENGSVKYTLEWQWMFEKDDAYDTFLGNESVEKLLEQTIRIDVRGEEKESEVVSGPQGTVDGEKHQKEIPYMKVKTGDESKVLLWVLACIMAAMATAVLIFMRFGKKELLCKIAGTMGKLTLLLFMISVIICNLYFLVEKLVYKENHPSIFGYSIAVVVSGSMADAINIDDLVVIHQDDHYDMGDIITYESGKSLVTHRIVGKTTEGFQTRGDANNIADINPVKEDQILGKVVKVVPGVGKVLYFFQSPFGLSGSMGRYSTGIHYTDHAGISTLEIPDL